MGIGNMFRIAANLHSTHWWRRRQNCKLIHYSVLSTVREQGWEYKSGNRKVATSSVSRVLFSFPRHRLWCDYCFLYLSPCFFLEFHPCTCCVDATIRCLYDDIFAHRPCILRVSPCRAIWNYSRYHGTPKLAVPVSSSFSPNKYPEHGQHHRNK